MISFSWSIISVLLEAIDGLGMDDFLESLAFLLPNFMVRTLIIILILSFLKTYWTLGFLLLVLGCNFLYLKYPACLSSYCEIPEFKNRITSMLVSLPLPVPPRLSCL